MQDKSFKNFCAEGQVVIQTNLKCEQQSEPRGDSRAKLFSAAIDCCAWWYLSIIAVGLW